MNDLINRQYVVDALDEIESEVADGYGFQYEKWRKYFTDLPSAQPELIRCRDCKFWQDQEEGVIEVPICARPENKYEKLPFRIFIGEDGFCSYAERRTSEDDRC